MERRRVYDYSPNRYSIMKQALALGNWTKPVITIIPFFFVLYLTDGGGGGGGAERGGLIKQLCLGCKFMMLIK